MHFDTKLIHDPRIFSEHNPPTATPIFQTATFAQSSSDANDRYDYSRSGNPTRDVLEKQLATLEEGEKGIAFSSGMAALTAVTSLVHAGETIVAGCDLYGGTSRLLGHLEETQQINVVYLQTWDDKELQRIRELKPKLVLIETPTNPLQKVVDIAVVAKHAHAAGALLAVDNTMLSPYLQKPLNLGADIVIHSATKSLSGHADVTAGAVITKDRELGEKIAWIQNATGTALAPFDCWVLSRGIKTLGVRLDRQQENARRIAKFLVEHPIVKRVYFPSLYEDEEKAIHQRQTTGDGSVISFATGSWECSERILDRLKLCSITVSFGSVATTVSLPFRMSHASLSDDLKETQPIPEDLIRLSVGIEDVADILADLEGALEEAIPIERKPSSRRTHQPVLIPE